MTKVADTQSVSSVNKNTASPMIAVQDLSLAYDDSVVLTGLNFSIKQGEIACILGPSGSGKTSILRAIAGFLSVKSGSIMLNNVTIASQKIHMLPQDRALGLVFQDFALFPHMTVQENVEFGLFKLSQQARQQKAHEYMQIMEISQYANKYPAELSGGQQQRVAIARAIAPEPKVLLMDEAFSSLDPSLREQVTQDVRDIVKRLGLTAILVTHDQSEAFAFADKIAIVAEGKLQQFSSAYALYHEPETFFVANFVGEGTFINGRVNLANSLVKTALGDLVFDTSKPVKLSADDQVVQVLLRPDDIIHDDNSPYKAEIVKRFFRGAFIKYQLRLPDSEETVLCFAPSHHNHAIGESFGIRVQIDHLICF